MVNPTVGVRFRTVNEAAVLRQDPDSRFAPSLTAYHSAMPDTKILYSDLDGTLLGPGGSLFTLPGERFSSTATDALLSLHVAGIKLVLVSGRTQEQMSELARVVSAYGYISEMGALVVDRRVFPEVVHANYGGFAGSGTPFEAMARSGAGAFLLETYPGSLEPHTPWSAHPRKATMLFRGQLDRGAAQAALEDAGYSWLELEDNGVIPRHFEGLEVNEVHAYHLVPKGVGKAAGVRRHLELVGIDPSQAAAIGDSLSDLQMAEVVGKMFIPANGRAAVGDRLPGNASYTEGAHGEGFAQAVAELLS